MDSIRAATMRSMPFMNVSNSNTSKSMTNEEHLITSRSSIWQQHTKHLHRMGSSPPNMNTINVNVSMANSMPISCVPQPTLFPNESRSTPTSSDQINEYDRTNNESPSARITQERINNNNLKSSGRDTKNGIETTTQHNNCDKDNDEKFIVTNDEDNCPKKMPSKELKRSDKNR